MEVMWLYLARNVRTYTNLLTRSTTPQSVATTSPSRSEVPWPLHLNTRKLDTLTKHKIRSSRKKKRERSAYLRMVSSLLTGMVSATVTEALKLALKYKDSSCFRALCNLIFWVWFNDISIPLISLSQPTNQSDLGAAAASVSGKQRGFDRMKRELRQG
jgi:hypothetical protein